VSAFLKASLPMVDLLPSPGRGTVWRPSPTSQTPRSRSLYRL